MDLGKFELHWFPSRPGRQLPHHRLAHLPVPPEAPACHNEGRREKIAQGLADAEAAARPGGRRAGAGAHPAGGLRGGRTDPQAGGGRGGKALGRAGQNAERESERIMAEARQAWKRQDMEKAVQGLSLELSGRILEKVLCGPVQRGGEGPYRGPRPGADPEHGER